MQKESGKRALPGTPRKLLFRNAQKTLACHEARSGFKRDCARVDTRDVSGVVADALGATADPRHTLKDAKQPTRDATKSAAYAARACAALQDVVHNHAGHV